MEQLSYTTIKQVLEMTTEILNRIRKNLGEKKYNEFINGSKFRYNGDYVGTTLQDFLLAVIMTEANNCKKKDYQKWRDEHFAFITSEKSVGPRGDYFKYARLFDGKIFAFGDEQGNYAGGDTVSMSFGGREGLLAKKESMSHEEGGSFGRDLYEKIKDCPIITEEEYASMSNQRMRWPRYYDYWDWFE